MPRVLAAWRRLLGAEVNLTGARLSCRGAVAWSSRVAWRRGCDNLPADRLRRKGSAARCGEADDGRHDHPWSALRFHVVHHGRSLWDRTQAAARRLAPRVGAITQL